MLMKDLIPASDFCINHNIEISFIDTLYENGLINITTVDETVFLYPDQLGQIEKIYRLYYDLGINIEGIETITYLLDRIDEMQDEIINLQNRLRLYE
jgi:chaperone modulatory protein CbpM